MTSLTNNLLIADDHSLVREGMVSLLRKFDGIDTIFTAENGKQALDILLTKRIDVALLDVRLPGLSGVDVAREVRQRRLGARIILITGETSEEAAARNITELSLDAFLFKTADISQIEQAIKTVLDGGTFFPPDVAAILSRHTDSAQKLSPREVQVVRIIAQGHTSLTAASTLGVSPHTVRKHRENIRRKLNLKTVADLSAYAHRNQIM